MFTCWDSSERTWCGVCDANVAVGLGFLQVVPLFASWSTILPPEILMCALIFLYCYVVFGPYNLVDYD